MTLNKAVLAEHARLHIAVLTAMAEPDAADRTELTRTVVLMLREMTPDQQLEHLIFVYRCMFTDLTALIADCGDTWPAYLQGAAAAFRAHYEEDAA